MRIIALSAITMIAFAANSVLNRLALADGEMGAASFAAIRLAAGAIVLVLLCADKAALWRGLRGQGAGAAALLAYMFGFSFAYISLDAGIGALVLFGGVQITMFAGALMGGEKVPWQRWAGSALAFGGLVYLLFPSQAQVQPVEGIVLMGVAAVGWGIYSLLGRGAGDPLRATASAFLLATGVALVPLAFVDEATSREGIMLAVVSGALTSGLGYAMWYSVLPQLGATRAAVLQLTVPLIAMAGGMVFLSEALTLRFVVASVLVIGGVCLSLIRRG